MILHVDDQALITKHVRDMLRDMGMFEVIYAQSVMEAKDRINEGKDRIKLVLTDIIMPIESENDKSIDSYGINTGIRLCKWIKENHTNIAVWALTVRSDISEQEFNDFGFDNYIQKPTNMRQLILEIQTNIYQ